ncbi:MAG: adenylosuccinate synthetase, partial [Thermoguttaceae bacterium]|nr:adenylosuccinate synthetase [Thermoguttaceae bacterium]
ENARKYVKKLGEIIGVPVEICSVGPDRTQTIFVEE